MCYRVEFKLIYTVVLHYKDNGLVRLAQPNPAPTPWVQPSFSVPYASHPWGQPRGSPWKVACPLGNLCGGIPDRDAFRLWILGAMKRAWGRNQVSLLSAAVVGWCLPGLTQPHLPLESAIVVYGILHTLWLDTWKCSSSSSIVGAWCAVLNLEAVSLIWGLSRNLIVWHRSFWWFWLPALGNAFVAAVHHF